MADEFSTFREAYRVLQRHAETLRSQTEPNIDDLLPMVEESVAAYRVCKERIDAVEKALEEAFTDVAPDSAQGAEGEGGARSTSGARSSRATPAAPTAGFDDMEDDIRSEKGA